MEHIKIAEEDFYDNYKPIKNHFDDNASWDGCMFETYGEEEAHVRQVADKKPNNVWTIVDCDGELIVVSGWCFVNRMGYLITEEPFNPENTYEVEED